MNVLVTGAAGYVGSALTHCLTARGHRVVAIDNDEHRLRRLSGLAFPRGSAEFHACSLDELARSPKLLSSVKAVLHLAGVSSDAAAEQNTERTWHVNVNLSIDVAQAARAAGIAQFILASTAAICQVPVGHRHEHGVCCEDSLLAPEGPIGVYARSKLAAERALVSLSDASFKVVVLRKGSMYGYSLIMRWDLIINRMALAAWLSQPLLLHDLGAVWRPIAHVQDAAQAYVRLVESPADSANAMVYNLVERNARLSEVCLEIDDVARSELGRGLLLQHGNSTLTQRTGRVSGEALRLVGWQPSRSLRDGVTELLRRLDEREIEMPAEILARSARV